MIRHETILAIVTFLLIFCSDAIAAGRSTRQTVDSLMCELDAELAQRQTYLLTKNARLDSLRANVSNADDDRYRFEALGQLYDEFFSFNSDSAFSVSLERERVARRIGDPFLIRNAVLNKANVYNATAMYKECLEILDTIQAHDLPDYLLPYYYHIKRTVYGYLADFSAVSRDRLAYAELTGKYRDSILSVNAPGTLAYTITYADKLNALGRPREAIEMIDRYCESNSLTPHERAIFSWTLSDSYSRLGDIEEQKIQLINSSLGDIRSSVREYVALRDLALILYREGDLDRAYKLMTIAVEDAEKCNARQRILELSRSYPMINSIYVDTVKGQHSRLLVMISVLAVVCMLLLILFFYIRRQKQRISNARSTIERNNTELQKLNTDLQDYVARLSDANSAIAENSELKEVYVGRYMDQCLAYIEKMDSYRKTVAKMYATESPEKLKKFLKSPAIIDAEFKAFYEQFDQTFLKMFPDFVADFNALLRPEEVIEPKHPGVLTPELRIYALYRLGITDSDKIAKFLRYSLTTIYNYRTKMRNKACGDRATFEDAVGRIGRQSSSR
ncbi:MAG: hypothetical protein K2I48_05330 [Muribaculaceae bacterium]|nr:hypothetical protein [Muribaculaceae bacterium]